MKKRHKQQTLLAVVQLHERYRRIIFLTTELKVIEEISLGDDPLQKGIQALMRRQSSLRGLIAVFGARRFSLTRTSALLVNVCSFLWHVPTASVRIPEDSNISSLCAALAQVHFKPTTLVVPDYVFPPHITQKKK